MPGIVNLVNYPWLESLLAQVENIVPPIINLVSNSILNIFFYTQIAAAVIRHQISFAYWADENFYWDSQVWKVQRLNGHSDSSPS